MVTAVSWLCCTMMGQISLTTAQNALPRGQMVPRVVTKNVPDQSYALYLPSNYDAQTRWPVIICFDPYARGQIPVLGLQDIAEKYGYVVAGSNQSRDPIWTTNTRAVDAIWEDLDDRLAVDPFRIYLIGLGESGRAVAKIAALTKQPAGIILCGAGFHRDHPPIESMDFAVVTVIGKLDQHFFEVEQLQGDLIKQQISSHHVTYEGGHEWPNTEALEEAVNWLQVRAVSEGYAAMRTDERSRVELELGYQSHIDRGQLLQALGLAQSMARLRNADPKWSERVERLGSDERVKGLQSQRKALRFREKKWIHSFAKRSASLARIKLSQKKLQREQSWWQAKQSEISATFNADTAAQDIASRLTQHSHRALYLTAANALQRNDLKRAQAVAKIAVSLNPAAGEGYYLLACTQAALDERQAAIASLRKALNSGFNPGPMTEDPRLSSLLEEPQFHELAQKAQQTGSAR